MIEKKRFFIFGSILIAVIVASMVFMPQLTKTQTKMEKPVVSVSTFSLYESAKAVGGDAVDVRSIVPLGSDAHMFSPNPSHVAELSKSALFVYNGAGFESWAEGMKKSLPSSVKAIDMSRYAVLLKSEHDEGHDAEHTDDHGEHAHGVYDPHYWLDIDNMIKMTQTLETEFSKVLPEKAPLFHQNAAAYIAELQKLKSQYVSGLAECQNRTLVSNHDAFGYLAHANKLEAVSVIGLSSDEQPSAKTMAHIVEVVKEHKIKTIFFEELINDNVSQTIARETGVKAVPLQPLENISEDELKSHQSYLSIMRENLTKLREAMECR